jgi:hypothetical protein
MARMLPEVLSPKVKSSAEKRIFNWFKKSQDRRMDKWIVLHSLGIESHFNRAYSEMDFLVLAPNLGIFSLEVKGGGVKRKDGIWEYTDRFDKNYISSRSPIDQAKEGMFNVMEYLRLHSDQNQLHKVLFGFGLMFPDIKFDNKDPEVDQVQFFDQRHKGDIYQYIVRLSQYHQQKLEKKYTSVFLPSETMVKEIARVLRPDFDVAISIDIKKQVSDEEVVFLTQEQYRCIDGLHSNPRCIITGYAGSGKSILALKYFKELLTQKVKVGYFCFNPELAITIRRHAEQELGIKSPYIIDFYSYVSTLLGNVSRPSGNEEMNEKQKEELLFLVADQLNQSKDNPAFDVIIVDQGQAFLNDSVCMVLDLLLKDGLAQGSWFLFGDFEVHKAFAKEMSVKRLKNMLLPYTKEIVVFQLTENCRNNPLIIHEANMFGGIKDIYVNPTTIYHHPVQYLLFEHDQDMINQVRNILKELLKHPNIRPDEITLIDYQSGLAPVVKKILELKPIDKYFRDVRISTPEKMLGLETKFVILLSVNHYHDRYRIYNTLLRAQTAVFVFETEEAKAQRLAIIHTYQAKHH